jgi:hypothetical protein
MRSQTTQQRQSPRFPQLRLAKIQPSGGGPTRFCLVTNMSDGGVRLHVLGAGIPNEFLLTLSGERPTDAGRYKAVWRLGTDVGAKRLAPAPDDEWSY